MSFNSFQCVFNLTVHQPPRSSYSWEQKAEAQDNKQLNITSLLFVLRLYFYRSVSDDERTNEQFIFVGTTFLPSIFILKVKKSLQSHKVMEEGEEWWNYNDICFSIDSSSLKACRKVCREWKHFIDKYVWGCAKYKPQIMR